MTNNHESQQNPDRKLLNDKEAAAELRMSQITLWRERKAVKISYTRLGGRIYYTPADLDQYRSRNRVTAAVAA